MSHTIPTKQHAAVRVRWLCQIGLHVCMIACHCFDNKMTSCTNSGYFMRHADRVYSTNHMLPSLLPMNIRSAGAQFLFERE